MKNQLFKSLLVCFVIMVAAAATAYAQDPVKKLGQNAKSYVTVKARAEKSRAQNELKREARNEVMQGVNKGINNAEKNSQSKKEAKRQAKIDAEQAARDKEVQEADDNVMDAVRAAQERSKTEEAEATENEQVIIEE